MKKGSFKICVPLKVNMDFSETGLLTAIKQYQDKFNCWPVSIGVDSHNFHFARELTIDTWLSVVPNTLPFAEWYVIGYEGAIYQPPL